MQQRRLGRDGPMVGAVGLGAWSFAGSYGPATVEESHATLAAALDLGVTHIDTSNRYGDGISEEIVGAFIKDHPGRFSIATKGGIINKPVRRFDNSPDHLRAELEGSLRRLGVEHVDLYYIHRREQARPIEEVVETLVRFRQEGKIGGFGFSEIAPSSLARATAVHPVRAVQNEYSLWTRQVELGLLQASERLGTSFVAFSPLARGMFADTLPDPAKFSVGDFRVANPRFNAPHFEENRKAVGAFLQLASEMGHAPASLAIAWTLARGKHVIPIPGTRSVAHLRQNAAGAAIRLNDADLKAIEAVLPAGFAHGPRYSEQQFVGIEPYC